MSKRKVFLLILLAFIMLGTIGVYCLNRYVLPVKIKNFAQTKLSETLHRDVTIGEFYINPFKGFIINNIKIYQKDSNETFAQVKEIAFKILPIPFLKSKYIVIPSIEITEPSANISRVNDQWNFKDLIQNDETSKTKSPYTFFLKKLNIIEGRVDLTDQTIAPDFSESIRAINLTITLSLDRHVPFSLKAEMPQNNTTLEARGDFDTKTRELKSFLAIRNLNFAKYNQIIKHNSSIDIPTGIITDSNLNITYQKSDIHLKGNITVADARIKTADNIFSGTIAVSNLDMAKSEKAFSASANIRSPAFFAQLSNDKTIKGKLDTNINTLYIDEEKTFLEADLDIDEFDARISNTTKIQGRLQTPQITFTKTKDSIKITGDITLDRNLIALDNIFKIKSQLLSQNSTFIYKDNIPSFTADLTLSNLTAQYKNLATITSNITMPDFSANLNGADIIINSLINTADTKAAFTNYSFDGSPQVNLSLSYNTESALLKYSGLATLKNFNIAGLPQIDAINRIQGDFTFANDQISTKNTTFLLNNSRFVLAGTLNSFSDPSADVEIAVGEILLTDIAEFIPADYFTKYQPTLTGKTSLNLKYSGQLQPFDLNAISAQAVLENASIESPSISYTIQNIFGKINYATDKLSWKTLRLKFNDKEYELSGNLSHFYAPQITTSLASTNLNINTSLNIDSAFENIDIENLKGNYFDTTFDLKGGYNLKQETVALLGPVKTDLKKLSELLPQMASANAQGILQGKISLKGPMKDWKNWNLYLNASSDSISLYNFPFTNVSINYSQKDRKIDDLTFLSNLYDGPLSIVTTANLETQNMPVKIKIDLEKFNLAKWRTDKKIVKKEFGGDLAAKINLSGNLNNMINIKGVGSLLVTNAYFRKLIPKYEGLNFTTAQARLNIDNQKIRTNDMKVLSDQLILKGKGWIDFQNNLDLDFTSVPTKLSSINTGGFKIDTSDLMLQLARINCKGKLNTPKCSVEISPMKATTEIIKTSTGILKEGTGIITEGVGSILDDLF